jgi:hypothetical protein
VLQLEAAGYDPGGFEENGAGRCKLGADFHLAELPADGGKKVVATHRGNITIGLPFFFFFFFSFHLLIINLLIAPFHAIFNP